MVDPRQAYVIVPASDGSIGCEFSENRGCRSCFCCGIFENRGCGSNAVVLKLITAVAVITEQFNSTKNLRKFEKKNVFKKFKYNKLEKRN